MMENNKTNSNKKRSQHNFVIKKIPLIVEETDLAQMCTSFGQIHSIRRNFHTEYSFINFATLRCSPQDVILGLKKEGIVAELTERSLKAFNNNKQLIDKTKRCVYCSQEAKTMCSKCQDFYCSVKCQKEDWPCHRYICFVMPELVNINVSNVEMDTELVDIADQNGSHNISLSSSHSGSVLESSQPAVSTKQTVKFKKCSKIEEQLLKQNCVNISPPKQQMSQQVSKLNKAPIDDIKFTQRGRKNVSSRNESSSISNQCTEPLKSLRSPQSGSLVVVTGIKSANVIYARMCDQKTNREYRNILEQINNLLEHAPSLKELPNVNSLAGAYFQDDGILYRVKVLGHQNQSKIRICYIDFGNEEFVEIKDLKELPKECQRFEVFPFAVELLGVPNVNNAIALKYLRNLESDESQQFKLFREEDSSMSELINLATGESLNTTILSLIGEKSKPKNGGHIRKPVLQAPFKIELLPIAENVPICILDNSLLELGVFAACKEEDARRVEHFAAKLQEYGKLDTTPYEPVKDEYCLVNFPDDERWYRGQVMQCLEKGRFLVCYIDYGNESTLSKQSIRRYPLEVTEPCRTSRCVLDGLASDISKDVEKRLCQLFDFGGRMVLSKVIKYEDGYVVVENNNVLETLRREQLMEK